MRLAAAAAIALAAAACGTSVLLPAAPPSANLDPIAFFIGRTHGAGTIEQLVGGSARLTVDSVGRRHGDMLILDQTIRVGDKPPRLRRWTMRPTAPGRYVGSLTDAHGLVQVSTEGPRAYVRYTMRDGIKVEQQLAIQSDGRTVLNRLDAWKFGIRVATLDETIRKLD